MRYCRVIAGNAFGKTVDTFELSCGKAIESSELMSLFCRDLEDNAGSNANDEDPACEVSEGGLEKISQRIYQGESCDIFNKEALKRNFCLRSAKAKLLLCSDN